MATSTLAAIQTKVRRLTGNASEMQLTTSDLNEYINTFYEQDLPSYLKLWNLHGTYTFYTQQNEDRYAFPVNLYHSLNPPIYIDGYQSYYTQSREDFFRLYPKLIFQQTGTSGNGTVGPYSFTFTDIPALRRDVTIFAADSTGTDQTAADDGNGLLIDTVTGATLGTVDYITGAITITFLAIIPSTQNVIAKYVPYQASRPDSMLFFQNYMYLRPVPDEVYKITVEVYQKPTQLLNSNPAAVPDIDQWWQLIAFGAAIKVSQDRLDDESIATIRPFFQEQMNLVMYRTATQIAIQRTQTIYTEQLQYPIGNRGNQAFP